MSAVGSQFDTNGNPITDQQNASDGNPITDALGNLIGQLGQVGIAYLLARGASGAGKLGKKTGSSSTGMGKVSKKTGGTNKPPSLGGGGKPKGQSIHINPPEIPPPPYVHTPATESLPPYSLTAPKVPFGKAPAPPPSLFNKAKSALSRTVRKIVPSKPSYAGRKPPPMPYKLATQKLPPPKPPRKRAGDRNGPLQALKTSFKVQKGERGTKGFTGQAFKAGEIFNKPLPPPPKPARSSRMVTKGIKVPPALPARSSKQALQKVYSSRVPKLPTGPKRNPRIVVTQH